MATTRQNFSTHELRNELKLGLVRPLGGVAVGMQGVSFPLRLDDAELEQALVAEVCDGVDGLGENGC